MTDPQATPALPKSNLRWMWRDYLRDNRWLIGLAMTLMAVEGAMLGALSYLIQPMFDKVFVTGDRGAVPLVALAIAGVFLIRAGSGFGHRVIMAGVSLRVVAALQRNLTRHVMTLDSVFFQQNSPGRLMERVRGDTAGAASIWGTVFAAAGRDVISLVSLLAVAASVDWIWTLIVAAGAPLLMAPIMILQRWVRTMTRAARNVAAHLSTQLDELFHGINTIKLNGTEDQHGERFEDMLSRFVRVQIRAEASQAGIPALIDVVAAIGFFGVLLYGGYQIIDGDKTVGQFMSFFTAIALVFDPLRRLGNVSGAWQVASASFERIREILTLNPTIASPALPVPPPTDPGMADVVLDKVRFAYGGEPVLRGLTFTARAGQTTALVGPSGAGKSTIFNLLTRLYDAQNGRVEIGSVPVRAMELKRLRGLFSVVTQDAPMFDETLRENIVMGLEGVTDRQLAEVLEAAHLRDFVAGLPAGLETQVGPRGSALSGGQRQRVAIARALLRDTPILLLDEATSALDAASEAAVQAALDRLSEGRTTLVIAHRLATIRGADRIVVMDQGRVVETGRHDELLARGGLYADLHRLQFRDI